MKYQDSSGLSQEEISNWDYDEAQKKAEEEAQLQQPKIKGQRIEEQLPPPLLTLCLQKITKDPPSAMPT